MTTNSKTKNFQRYFMWRQNFFVALESQWTGAKTSPSMSRGGLVAVVIDGTVHTVWHDWHHRQAAVVSVEESVIAGLRERVQPDLEEPYSLAWPHASSPQLSGPWLSDHWLIPGLQCLSNRDDLIEGFARSVDD